MNAPNPRNHSFEEHNLQGDESSLPAGEPGHYPSSPNFGGEPAYQPAKFTPDAPPLYDQGRILPYGPGRRAAARRA